MVAHTYRTSTWRLKQDSSSRPAWATEWVWGQPGIYSKTLFRKLTGEITPPLKVLAGLLEDCVQLSAPMYWFITGYNFSSRGSHAFFWPPPVSGKKVHRYTGSQNTYIYFFNLIIKKNKKDIISELDASTYLANLFNNETLLKMSSSVCYSHFLWADLICLGKHV